MFNNENHPENQLKKNAIDFLKNEQDVRRLANHMANMTEHLIDLTNLLNSFSKEMMAQKRAFNNLRSLILRSMRDEDEDDFPL
tara:strand:- start:315 stop:563 length:249 start_codon:yes stop_codon:yes gene_type:complete